MAGPVPGPMHPPPSRPRGGGGRRVLVKTAWCAVPVLTLGLLAFIPSLCLAVRHGRPRYWVLAAFFLATTVWQWTVFAVMPDDVDRATLSQNLVAALCLLANTAGAVAQFLVMDRPVRRDHASAPRGPAGTGYAAAAPSAFPHPAHPAGGHPGGPARPQGPYPPAPYHPSVPRHHVPHQPQPPYSGAPPRPSPPAPGPGRAPGPAALPSEADRVKAELEEISELLRRKE